MRSEVKSIFLFASSCIERRPSTFANNTMHAERALLSNQTICPRASECGPASVIRSYSKVYSLFPRTRCGRQAACLKRQSRKSRIEIGRWRVETRERRHVGTSVGHCYVEWWSVSSGGKVDSFKSNALLVLTCNMHLHHSCVEEIKSCNRIVQNRAKLQWSTRKYKWKISCHSQTEN